MIKENGCNASSNEEMMNEEYMGRIRTRYDSLSKMQKKIANYILDNAETVSQYSITQLSKKIGTVPSTITRFCQALSFKGFSELKVYLEKGEVVSLSGHEEITRADTTEIVMRKLMMSYQNVVTDSMRTLDAKVLRRSVDKLLTAGTIIFFGQSSGYVSALYAQEMLLRIGMRSHAVSGETVSALMASTLREKDVAIGIAYSGEVSAIIEALSIAKKNRAVIIVITANANSTMAKMANYKLLYSYSIPDDLQYHYQASMSEMAIIGTIQAEILRRQYSDERVRVCRDVILGARKK